MTVIVTESTTKRFGDLVAVDNISFSIEDGELFGLLGPNGAGKTTLLKMLSTLLRPTGGSAHVCGYDVQRQQDDVRRCIGMTFQDPSTDTELTGRENLDFHARMYGMSRELRKARLKEVMMLVELEDKIDVQLKNYSEGMRRRLEIARGLMHHPQVLFLDEPTVGLDAQTRRKIWDYIKDLNRRENVTVIITTHYMDEADYLCSRVAIIDRGRIIAIDTPEKLKDSIGVDIVSLRIDDGIDTFVDRVKTIEWIEELKQHDGYVDLCVKNGDTVIPKLISIANDEGVLVSSVNLRSPTLEDVFLQYTGKTIREEEADGGAHARAVMRVHMKRMRRSAGRKSR